MTKTGLTCLAAALVFAIAILSVAWQDVVYRSAIRAELRSLSAALQDVAQKLDLALSITVPYEATMITTYIAIHNEVKGPHTVTTVRLEGESDADWRARHFAAVTEAQTTGGYPPA